MYERDKSYLWTTMTKWNAACQKIQAFNRIRTHGLCDTGAMLSFWAMKPHIHELWSIVSAVKSTKPWICSNVYKLFRSYKTA